MVLFQSAPLAAWESWRSLKDNHCRQKSGFCGVGKDPYDKEVFQFYNLIMKLVFLVVMFLSVSAGATEVVIHRTNHLGFEKTDVLKKNSQGYFFGTQSLGKTLPANVKVSWDALSRPPGGSPLKHCDAGTYLYIKRDSGKKESARKGCLESPEYGEVLRHLDQVQRYARHL